MIEIVCKTKAEANELFNIIHWINMNMKVTIFLDVEGYHFQIEEIST